MPIRILPVILLGVSSLAACSTAGSVIEEVARRSQADLANTCSDHVGYIVGQLASGHGVVALDNPVVEQRVDAGVNVGSMCGKPGNQTVCASLAKMIKSIHQAETLFVTAIERVVFATGQASTLKTIYADAIKNGHRSFQKAFTQWSGPDPKSDVIMNAGGGFGFGFQVFCGCEEIFTAGMGFGGGFTSSSHGRTPGVDGGQGGGGGFQIFLHKGQVASVGGGGGGDLNASYGWTEDGDQSVPDRVTTMKDLWSGFVQRQIDKCGLGNVSITAGGGGGFGVVASSSDTSRDWAPPAIWYGGGFSWRRASKSLARLNKTCGGGIHDAGDDPKFQNITKLTDECHDTCMSNPATFYVCYCQCTRRVYLDHKMAWAEKMQCPTASPSSPQAGVILV